MGVCAQPPASSGVPAAWAVWVVFGLLSLASAAFASEVRIRAGLDSQRLDGYGEYLRDPSGALEPHQLIATADWQPATALPGSLGFSRGVYWRRLELHNLDHPDSRWVLLIEYPLLDRVDVYVQGGNGSLLEARSGDHRPFAMRGAEHRHPNVLLSLPAGQTLRLWVRIENQGSMQLPMRLSSERALREQAQLEYSLLGLYFGLLGGLLLYNLLLYGFLREAEHLWYAAYVAAFGWLQLCLTGIGFQYLWPTQPFWSNTGLLWAACLAQAALLKFTRHTLLLHVHAPDLGRAFDRYALLLLVGLALAVLLPYRIVMLLITVSVFALAALVVGATLLAIGRGHPSARILLMAWLAVLAGVLAYALLAFGWLPKWWLFEHGIQLGSALELVLLSAALAHRVNRLTDENRRLAENDLARLERRVAERTAALDRALAELSEANRQLRAHAERDGLTGVYNRRLGAEALEQLHAESRAQEQPAALLMIDLDHFKSVNDCHGHLRGDDCLRELARVLQSRLQAEDRLVRWGGEEFLVLLKNRCAETARQLAEGLRLAVECSEALAEAGLTISIGVAESSTAESPAAWLQAADEALYEAKRAGRNRVRVAAGCA